MKTWEKVWRPFVVLALALAVFGVGKVRAATTHEVLIAPAAFVPRHDQYVYVNYGSELRARHELEANFVAPVELPIGARVQKVIFWAYDNASEICVRLFRVTLAKGQVNQQAFVCSTGNSPTFPRAFSTKDISYRLMKVGTTAYISVQVRQHTGQAFYGAKVIYTLP